MNLFNDVAAHSTVYSHLKKNNNNINQPFIVF